MAGTSGDVPWTRCGDIRAVVLALMAGSGVCGMCGGPVVERFLGRLVASGPPRLVGCFGMRVLRRMVAAFSTFSLVCVVVLVRHELAVRFRVSLAPEL